VAPEGAPPRAAARREALPVEDVVAERERDAVAPTKSRPMTNACANPSGAAATA
jgi:hypothetical protein